MELAPDMEYHYIGEIKRDKIVIDRHIGAWVN
jgi:hypothetical protein